MIERERIAETFTEHRRRVEATADRIVRDREDAADVTSDTFLTLLERGPADERAVLPWLLTTARNRALNTVRSRRRAAARLRLLVAEPAAEHAPSPAAHQIGTFVRATMSRLSARDRLALALRYEDEEPYEEIARALNVTVAQARVIVHRATNRLRREAVVLLAEEHDAPAACVQAMARAAERDRLQPHAGCGPCAAVLDEVSALRAPALIAFGPRTVPAVIERISSAMRRMRPPRSAIASRVAEAMAALALASTVGTGAGAVAAADAPTRDQLVRAQSLPADVDSAARATMETIADGLRATAALAIDDGSDPSTIPGTGSPLVRRITSILDPLESGSDAVDLRRFEVASLTGTDGSHGGIRFRLDTAGPPDLEHMSFDVTWLAKGCNADIYLSQGSAPVFSTSCSTEFDLADPLRSPPSHEGRVHVQTDTRGITLTILIDEQPPAIRNALERGTVLTALTSSSCCRRSTLVGEWDYAPDGDGLRYRIR